MGTPVSMPPVAWTGWRARDRAGSWNSRRDHARPAVGRRPALALGLRGGLALLFGALALLWPGLTPLGLALLFAAYAFVDGVGMLGAAVPGDPAHEETRWDYLLAGLAGVLVSFMTLLWPQITLLALVMVVGAWAVVTGLLEVSAAVTGLLQTRRAERRRRSLAGEWLLGSAGISSVAAGIVVLLQSGAGAVALATVLGSYALVAGALLLAAAWHLRNVHPRLRGHEGERR